MATFWNEDRDMSDRYANEGRARKPRSVSRLAMYGEIVDTPIPLPTATTRTGQIVTTNLELALSESKRFSMHIHRSRSIWTGYSYTLCREKCEVK